MPEQSVERTRREHGIGIGEDEKIVVRRASCVVHLDEAWVLRLPCGSETLQLWNPATLQLCNPATLQPCNLPTC